MTARRTGALLLLLLACVTATQALADVRASLDVSQITVGETVQLTLEHDGSTSGQPDVTSLQQEFDILGTSSSTMIQLINGSASEKTQVVLTLSPKVAGHLTIPALSWDGEKTQPLSLDVAGPGGNGKPGAAGAPATANVFMETSASPDQPYVQAAIQLTVHLYIGEVLYRPSLELPESSDFVVKRLGSDKSSEAERNGRTYQVITRQYLLFPQHSGNLTLPGPILDAEVALRQPSSSANGDPFGGFFGGPVFQTVPVRVHGTPIVLSVRPRPSGAVGNYWLPSREVSLSAAWNPVKLTAQTGDPVTLDLDLQATGLAAAQLPDISSLLSLPAGLKAYPDQPKLDDSTLNGQWVGSRDQTIALMADSPGSYTIPAITLTWWDTQTDQPRTATLPARTLTILPAPGGPAVAAAAPAPAAQPAPAPTPSQHAPTPPSTRIPTSVRSPSTWEWISISLAVVWLGTVGAWLWSRRSRAAPRPRPAAAPSGPRHFRPDAAKERAAFRAACEADDPPAARTHLLAWATAVWGNTPAGINALGAKITDPAVADLLRDLDRACYAGGAWEGAALAAALTELPASSSKVARQRDGLSPLYP